MYRIDWLIEYVFPRPEAMGWNSVPKQVEFISKISLVVNHRGTFNCFTLLIGFCFSTHVILCNTGHLRSKQGAHMNQFRPKLSIQYEIWIHFVGTWYAERKMAPLVWQYKALIKLDDFWRRLLVWQDHILIQLGHFFAHDGSIWQTISLFPSYHVYHLATGPITFILMSLPPAVTTSYSVFYQRDYRILRNKISLSREWAFVSWNVVLTENRKSTVGQHSLYLNIPIVRPL